ncbi:MULTISPECIES: hypothetical protein [Sulfolobaceae]|nr:MULTISPECIES: hypothetical protein [unclassified Sulfolobus]
METKAKIEDDCVRECYSPSSQWKFIDISECLAKCKNVSVAKP